MARGMSCNVDTRRLNDSTRPGRQRENMPELQAVQVILPISVAAETSLTSPRRQLPCLRLSVMTKDKSSPSCRDLLLPLQPSALQVVLPTYRPVLLLLLLPLLPPPHRHNHQLFSIVLAPWSVSASFSSAEALWEATLPLSH